jgi:hypothetical protein
VEPVLPEGPPESETSLNVGGYAAAYAHVVAALKPLCAQDVLGAVAGLLTIPDLHANCFRLEVLAHLAAAYCRGRISPTPTQIKFLFDLLDEGRCGGSEDPAESVFVGLVNTARGNFRVLEGLWRGTSFYLQLILDVLEKAPVEEHFDLMRRSINSLLRLSEAVAGRSGVAEYELGRENPVSTLSDELTANLPSTNAHATFGSGDVRALGIDLNDLSPFVFDPASRPALLNQEVGNSDLERYPLALCDERLILVIPTAIAAAIIRFVIESVKFLQIERKFEMAFASEVVSLMRDMPVLGKLTGLPLARAQIENCLIGHQLVEIDVGRYLQMIVVFESLAKFEERGLNGEHEFSDELNAGISTMIVAAHREATEKCAWADGVTLIVSVGVSRGFGLSLVKPLPEGWRLCAMPIHDLVTASWLQGFEPLNLWRLDDAQAALSSLGVILMNQSGLLNLIGCTQELNGRIVGENMFSDSDGPSGPMLIVLPTNMNRQARHDGQKRHGGRRALDVEGRWVHVQRFGGSPFGDEDSETLCVSDKDLSHGELRCACLTGTRAWWLDLKCPEDSPKRLMFEYWRSLCLWLSQVVAPLENAYPKLRTGAIHFIFVFDEITASGNSSAGPLNENQTRELVEVEAAQNSATITIRVRSGFEDGFIQAENVGDRALVEAMVIGVAEVSGSACASTRENVLDAVCPRGGARRIHRWSSSAFRDFMRQRLSDPPVVPDPMDYATSLLGLGHKLPSCAIPCAASGLEECLPIINGVVEALLKEIASELNKYDRRAFVERVVRNYETAACHRDHWRQTSRALVATQKDDRAAVDTIMQQNSKYNTCSIASRILLEAALCECPLDSGRHAGDLDLAHLMAKVMIVHQFGGWSDAIRWKAMVPEIRVTVLGEIQANVEFMRKVYHPFGRSGGQSFVEHAIESYDSFFQQDQWQTMPGSELDQEFPAAWKAEFIAPVQAFRDFVTQLELRALESNREVVDLRRSELAARLAEAGLLSNAQATEALAFITSTPRSSWFWAPEDCASADWYPWRFRRRLAILRRPFLQLDETADPIILCAPGLLGDAFRSMVTWYRKGEIQKARTGEMQRWMGRVNNVQRSAFNQTVAKRLRQLGWEARAEINVTEILGRSFERDYGDVDVLAWRTDSGRILAIECKDLQAQTTISEVAEQLSDFRGETRPNGKRDHLKRHLDRIAILSQNADAVARFLKLSSRFPLEGHLVFSRNVPMRFAREQISAQVKLSLFSELEGI